MKQSLNHVNPIALWHHLFRGETLCSSSASHRAFFLLVFPIVCGLSTALPLALTAKLPEPSL